MTDEWIEQRHAALLRQRITGATVLDVGCGQGRLVSTLSCQAAFVYGVEAHRPSIERAAAQLASRQNVLLLLGTALDLPFDNASLDVVCCAEVLEHVPSPQQLLAELYRVVRPGGCCTLSTPNGWIQWWPHPYQLANLALRPRRTLLRMMPERDWAGALPFHPATRPRIVRAWCERAGFRVRAHCYTLLNEWTRTRFRYRLFVALDRAGANVLPVYQRMHVEAERAFARGSRLAPLLASRQVLLLEKPEASG